MTPEGKPGPEGLAGTVLAALALDAQTQPNPDKRWAVDNRGQKPHAM